MKFLDLFCGAGGFSCGLELAGFTPVFACDIDSTFTRTFKANNEDVPVINDDIRNISNAMLDSCIGDNNVDVIVGGPPCQGYSIIAPNRSLDDPRNHLFKEYIRIVAYVRPKALIIENVPGIVSFEKGLVIKNIYESLAKLGYKTDHKILCAAHYGAPQTRFRAVFIAIREHKKDIEFPAPQYNVQAYKNFSDSKKLCFDVSPLLSLDLKKKVSIADAIGDLPPITDEDEHIDREYSTEAKTEFQVYSRAGSEKLTSHHCAKLAEINRERLKYIPQGGSWRDIPYDLLPAGLKRARRSDHTKRYGRLEENGLCSTLQTKCDPHWGCFFHPTQDRIISVREAARIQSFPDRIKFAGNLTQQYKQVGNAVPPLLGKALGESLKRMLSA